jgi:hypothetical protein
MEKPEDCSICLEKLNDEKVLECGHYFHNECIKKQIKAECALCRKPFVSYFSVNNLQNFRDYNIYYYNSEEDITDGEETENSNESYSCENEHTDYDTDTDYDSDF